MGLVPIPWIFLSDNTLFSIAFKSIVAINRFKMSDVRDILELEGAPQAATSKNAIIHGNKQVWLLSLLR